jgi:hypothetical protein
VARILLCGEGPHDIGQHDWMPTERRHIHYDGWLQCIIRQVGFDDDELSTKRRNEIILLPRDQRRHRPLPPGHGAKALAAKLIAKIEGYDIVIFMVDADSNDPRSWKETRSQIIAGFAKIDGVCAIACVPMSASESWLLADEDAWLGLGLLDTTLLPTSPESIWGRRNDSNGNHPHSFFARVCEHAGVSDSRETRAVIAENSSVRRIDEKCPVSFRSFAKDLDVLRPISRPL